MKPTNVGGNSRAQSKIEHVGYKNDRFSQQRMDFVAKSVDDIDVALEFGRKQTH